VLEKREYYQWIGMNDPLNLRVMTGISLFFMKFGCYSRTFAANAFSRFICSAWIIDQRNGEY